MFRCSGTKAIGGVCSDVRCHSHQWHPTTHYHHDGFCGLCGKPAMDVLACDTCNAVDPHDGYGRYAEKDGAPCGRLYELDTLAPDSDDDEPIGYPLVKSPPLRRD